MKRIVEAEFTLNRSTQDAWHAYRNHRKKVTDMVTGALRSTPMRRLCVLGAGNLNDLTLNNVFQRFDAIHLVDLDFQAVQKGVLRQLPGGAFPTRVNVHAPIDISGILQCVAELGDGGHVSKQKVKKCQSDLASNWLVRPDGRPRLLEQFPAALALTQAAPFDVVASAGMLSRLVHHTRIDLNPAWLPIRLLVESHLDLMLSLVAPSGKCVVIVDVAQTDNEEGLEMQLEIDGWLKSKIAARQVESVRQSECWEWQIRPRETRLCHAITFENSKRTYSTWAQFPEKIRNILTRASLFLGLLFWFGSSILPRLPFFAVVQ